MASTSSFAPPQVREQRELVRYRAKLVATRSGLKAQVHAVLAKAGVLIAVSDLFGVTGRQRLATVPLGSAYAERVRSLLELIDVVDDHEARFAGLIAKQLAAEGGFTAVKLRIGRDDFYDLLSDNVEITVTCRKNSLAFAACPVFA